MSRVAVFFTLVGFGAAACSGEAGDHEQSLEDDFKGCPPELPMFAPGLQAAGKQHSVRLRSSEPAEPERYENDWVVELEPSDAQLLRAQTFMPLHGHDGRVTPEIKALAAPGQFAIERLNFTMRGPWEVRLWLSSLATAEDYVVFQVCVAK